MKKNECLSPALSQGDGVVNSKGWKYVKLGDCCSIIGGGTPNKKNNEYYGNDIPWATVRDMNCDYLSTTELRITHKGLSNSSSHIIQKNEIIIASRVGLGKVCILCQDTAINQDLKGVVPKKEHDINRLFLFYWFKSIARYIITNGVGATVQGVKLSFISELQIPLPPLSEQEEIVTYLDTSFAKIDAIKANAEKELEEAKKLFAAALNEAMTPKEGWVEKTLGEIATDSADGPFGSNLKKAHYTQERQVRIIQLSNIGEDGWREENTKYTTFEHLKNISRSEVEPNDIVIAKMMPAGRAILCPNHEAKFVLSSDAVKIKLPKDYNERFILNFINSPYFRRQVYENVSGSGRVRTSLTKLRACTICFPDKKVQQSIVTHLDTLSEKVRQLQSNYEKISSECDALKQAILRDTFE